MKQKVSALDVLFNEDLQRIALVGTSLGNSKATVFDAEMDRKQAQELYEKLGKALDRCKD